jgi:hypothetical protein
MKIDAIGNQKNVTAGLHVSTIAPSTFYNERLFSSGAGGSPERRIRDILPPGTYRKASV